MLSRSLWHKSVTDEAVSEACADQDDTGFCLVCGAMVNGIEPDAANYRCPHCTAEQVFGAEEILLQIAF